MGGGQQGVGLWTNYTAAAGRCSLEVGDASHGFGDSGQSISAGDSLLSAKRLIAFSGAVLVPVFEHITTLPLDSLLTLTCRNF